MIALIILHYNSFDDTAFCADRLLSFDRDYRIVIVDNCSTDGTGTVISERYAGNDRVDVILSDRNGGYGAGNNIGIRHVLDHYDVRTIGILNPDVEISDPDMIDRMEGLLYSDDSFGIIGGRIVGPDGTYNLNDSAWAIPTAAGLMSFQSLRTGRFDRPAALERISDDLCKVDCTAGCFFLVKTECMTRIGMFDENMFLYFEEIMLGIKCRDAGYKEVLAINECYRHNHHSPDNSRLSLKEKLAVTDHAYRSAQYLCRRYYGRHMLVPLWFVERHNKLILLLAYIKYRIMKDS